MKDSGHGPEPAAASLELWRRPSGLAVLNTPPGTHRLAL